MSPPFASSSESSRPLAASNSKNTPTDKKGAQIHMKHSPSDTLEDRCRSVIVANLERYPPETLGVLPEESWDAILRERNERTRPAAGTGGLDGSGRLLPAISDKFLSEVERVNPHFADSDVADRLVWKDCVEYRFRSGGLSRPSALRYPWPLLVNKLKRSGETLTELLNFDQPSDRNNGLLERHAKALSETPMNVSLLQASGIGKSVKKFVKASMKEKPDSSASTMTNPECPKHEIPQTAKVTSRTPSVASLRETLDRWKEMAAAETSTDTPATTNDEHEASDEDGSEQDDLRLAESCQSWRELFLVLQEREEKRRARQGERMRERRQKLDARRPKIIKVRPSKSRHDTILDRPGMKGVGSSRFSSSAARAFSSGNAKLKALKKESKIAATLQKSSARPNAKKNHSFGAAVAVATNATPSSPSKRRTGQVMTLPGGKRMKMGAKKRPPTFQSRR